MGAGAGEMTERQEDPTVGQLVNEIEVTREEMTVTVEEIGDRLDPRNMVEDAKASVRDATVGKVEQMANSAEQMVDQAGQAVEQAGSGIIETIRRNPVPAALAGIGIGWLAMSARNTGGMPFDRQTGRYRYPGYARGGDLWRYRSEPSGGSSDLGERAGEVADRLGRTVERGGDQLSAMAGEMPNQARDVARQAGDEAGRMYRENPLAMGAIAVAVGAAIGMALPATDFERRTIGRPSRELLDKAGDAAGDALGTVEEQAREVEQQARDEEQRAKAS
ncbi:MAG: DUF3618 domain-containing protein [Chloroflexi bacterium]|nr:DUF3618 domain-containing protein [Chloroflexota bacterium]